MKSKEILPEDNRKLAEQLCLPIPLLTDVYQALLAAEAEIEELQKQIDSEKPSYEAGSNLGALIKQHTDDILKGRKG